MWPRRYNLEPILIVLQATRMLLLVLTFLSSSFLLIVKVLLMCANRVLVYILDILSLYLRGLAVRNRLIIILRILVLDGLIDELRLRVGVIVWHCVLLH